MNAHTPTKRRRAHRLMGWLVIAVISGSGAIGIGCRSDRANRPKTGNVLVDLVAPLVGGESPAEVTRAMFDGTNPDRRRYAVVRTANAPWGGDAKYVRLYRMMLGSFDDNPDAEGSPDPDPTVRAAAIQALGRHGEPADAELIAPRLDSDSTFVRWEAAKALQRLHRPSPAVIRPLIERVTRDEDPDVRLASATALGQYPRPDVFDALVAALSDEEYSVRHAARESLTTLTGTDEGAEATAWLDWAAKHRGNLFNAEETFTYRTYQPPRGLIDKLRFWEDDPNTRRLPEGYDTDEAATP